MDQYRAKPPQQKAAQQQPRQAAPAPVQTNKATKFGIKKIAIILTAVLIIVAGLGVGWKAYNNKGLTGVDTNRYQALFLTNGQVYFGKLSKADGKTVRIDDIFYLQVQQAVHILPLEVPWLIRGMTIASLFR